MSCILDFELVHRLHRVEGYALEAPPADREDERIIVLQDLLVPPVLLDAHLHAGGLRMLHDLEILGPGLGTACAV